MTTAKGPAHRSDHSYDERDDIFFDSDDERDSADAGDNSDEDTEDASETDMVTMEEEFTEMKEQMYQEKIKDLRKQLEQLKDGTHPDYRARLKQIEQQKEDYLKMTEAFKDYEKRETEREFEREKRQAKQELERKKIELKESLLQDLLDKKKSIENEKATLELTGEILEIKTLPTRKLRRRPNDPPPQADSKKRKTNGIQLNYLLTEDSIMSDLKKLSKLHKGFFPERSAKVKFSSVVGEDTSPTDGNAKQHFDARIEDGKLYYEKKWYYKGQAIFLEHKDGVRYNALIHSIGTNEIWIKKLQENKRLKIYVSHLQKGKYSVRKRPTGQNVKDA
ncbi:sin3 histone deacetylase corepressor complex component SDS3-like isoform X2 [Rhopilema esculentum]|uniref:sin3 histone deacetylase corepressor complex component SDS3-like isoform X2 n=1 Tax=Rhopilema esculentum TaxID=499914 RepID=UPI0031DF5126